MAVKVRIPTALRKFTNDTAEVSVEAADIREVLAVLAREHPQLTDKICDAEGAPKRFVNVYCGDEDIRFLDGVDTKVADGAEVSIVPAIAGG